MDAYSHAILMKSISQHLKGIHFYDGRPSAAAGITPGATA